MMYINGETLFSKMSGYKNSGLYKYVYLPIVKGNEKKAGIKRELVNLVESIENFKAIRKELVNNKPEMYKYTIGEHKMNMSKDELLDLYATSKDPWSANDIVTGGYKQSGHQDPVVFKIEDLAQIESIMKQDFPELVNFYESMRAFYKRSGELLNETHNDIHGYPLFREMNDYYYPKRALNQTQVFTENPTFIPPSLEGYRILKERTNNTSGVKGGSFIKNMHAHVEMISGYGGLAQPLREARLVLNDKRVTRLIGATEARVAKDSGEQSISYLSEFVNKYLNDVARNLPNSYETIMDTFYNDLVSNMQVGALGANWAVMLKQLTSYPIAMGVINPKHLIDPRVLKRVPKSEMVDIMYKYAPTIWERFTQGHSTIELGDMSAARALRGNAGIVKRLQNVNWGYGMSKLDEISVNRIWNASKLQVEAKGLKAGTEEYWQAVGRLTQDALYVTQPMYDATFRTGLQRSKNPVVRLSTLFSSQAQQNLNIMVRGFDKMKAGRRKDGMRDILSILGGTMAIASAEMAIDYVRGKDEISFGKRMLDNSVDSIMFVNKVWRGTQYGWSQTNLVDDNFNKVVSQTMKLAKIFEEPDVVAGYDKVPKLLFDTVAAYSNFAGIPVANIKKTFDDFIRKAFPPTVVAEYNGLWRAKGYGEHYQDYYNIYKKGDTTDLVPILQELKKNGAKQQGLRDSTASKIAKDLKVEFPSYTDEQINAMAKSQAQKLPYLNTLPK